MRSWLLFPCEYDKTQGELRVFVLDLSNESVERGKKQLEPSCVQYLPESLNLVSMPIDFQMAESGKEHF